MRRTTWVVGIGTVLGCILWALQVGAEGITRRAQIVWPAHDGTLCYKGVIEVALEGLAPEHYGSLVVRVEAVSGGESIGPIALWEGWPEIPVSPGGSNPLTDPAWVIWTNRELGRALLRVKWNYFPPGFRGGQSLVQVEILVRADGQRVWLWGQTGWHPVRLNTDYCPSLVAALVQPTPNTELGLGDRVVVTGYAANAAVPLRVSLEIGTADDPLNWRSVAQKTFDTASFSIDWYAVLAHLGKASIRVSVMDARGAHAVSSMVDVTFVPKPLRVQWVSPEPGVEVTIGQVLLLRGQVLSAAFPIKVVIEARREVGPVQWEHVGAFTIHTTTFDFRWDTSRLEPGAYFLRANAADAQGVSANSDELKVIVREKKFEIRVAGKPVHVAEVREREPVQFEVETDVPWTAFSWDFGDGKTSNERNPVHIYHRAGTYKVCVTAFAPDRSHQTKCEEIHVKLKPTVVATRRILGYPNLDCTVTALVYIPIGGSPASAVSFPVRVELTIFTHEPVTALLVTEILPAGWTAMADDVIDENLKIRVMTRGQELVWLITSIDPLMAIEAGTRLVVAYTLTPPAQIAYQTVGITGKVHAQAGPEAVLDGSFTEDSHRDIVVVRKLDPIVALLYLEKREDGSLDLAMPWEIRSYSLTLEQLQIAEQLVLSGQPVKYADTVLKLEDYLRLLAYFQAQRPVVDCPPR